MSYNMKYLDEELILYSKTDAYPFHMPGHKRQNIDFPNPYSIDITEIDGFDNLHHAEGIIKEAQERAAELYGSEHCYYLVNGSTCGLLAAVCAATKKRDKILVARNSHKAVYHAMSLNELDAVYLYPRITVNDLQGQITVKQVEKALYEHPDIAAVMITSPTYEGIISDVAGIAKVCHAHSVPLIVDEAHGAHLGFGAGFPENAVRLGADAVIMSLHKTLPSFTQTALLHINGDRIVPEQVQRYLGVFQTSSPSYLFMAGMDACVRMLIEQGKELSRNYRKLLDDFYQETAELKNLHVMQREDLNIQEAYGWDDSKLVIYAGDRRTDGSDTSKKRMTGEELYQILLKKYHLQMEMASGNYVLGMTSIMDNREGLERLTTALKEIDDMIEIEKIEAKKLECMGTWGSNKSQIAEAVQWEEMSEARNHTAEQSFTARMYTKNRQEMQIYQAVELPYREVSFDEAVGKMAADYVFLYPPGIPMIVPGEVISPSFIEKIRECQGLGLNVSGQSNLCDERIKIVYF